MKNDIAKRLEKLESMVAPSLKLLCTMPDGKQRVLSVGEYLQQPQPLDFKVTNGDSLTDAGAVFVYLLRCFHDGAELPHADTSQTDRATHAAT